MLIQTKLKIDEHKGEKNQLTLITCDDYNEQTGVWENVKSLWRNKLIKCIFKI